MGCQNGYDYYAKLENNFDVALQIGETPIVCAVIEELSILLQIQIFYETNHKAIPPDLYPILNLIGICLKSNGE